MDLQSEAIELQKIFHKDYKTYWEETEAIKNHLEARFKALNIQNVSVSVFCVTDEISECIISVHRTRLDAEDAIKENLNSSLDLYVDEVDL